MIRSWRGKGSSAQWYKNRKKKQNDTHSLNNYSVQVSSSIGGSSRVQPNKRTVTVTLSVDTNNVWKSYFPTAVYDAESQDAKHIQCFKSYVDKNRSTFDLEKIDHTRSAPLDLHSLLNDPSFMDGWSSFNNDLFENPEHTLKLLEFSLHESLKCESKLRVRILNHQPIVPLANLKVNYFGKLVTIKGTVIRVGSVGLISTSIAFECSSCQSVQAVIQPQGVFTGPNFCINCKSGCKFEPLHSSPLTVTTDCQTAKIQEIQSQGISGIIPKSVEIELQGDLVGTACPGDVLSVTGIVKVRGESRGGEDGRRAARLLQLYIEAVTIHSQRNLSNPTLSFTLKDYYAIQEIHATKDVFRLLVHSLCPAIFGHEAVKAGLMLGLMGGTDADNGPRSNPHVLVVGDPGLGKSQLLQAAAHAAPRGVYVCGASASAGGLTVALGREAGGDFALEAGALVLADKGICCVDELDKMTSHHSSLLEAMEQGRVSVAKGGVVCSLAARATVLAAANPTGGNYNRAKTVAENLKLNSALLSRFDLVFILLDQPDEKIDAMLSEHVLALHAGRKRKDLTKNPEVNISISSQNSGEQSLSKKLRLNPGEVIDTLPIVLLRKYIAYARRYVHPQLSHEAALTIQNFYLELRRNHQDGQHDGTPITTRQLEACVRLTQARARADLREEATVEDALDVISLVKHSLIDTFTDEFGNIQLSRSINGSGVSARSKLKKFLAVLTKRAQQLGKDLFTKQELCQIHRAAGIQGDANSLIEDMHVHCYLLLKASNMYQLI